MNGRTLWVGVVLVGMAGMQGLAQSSPQGKQAQPDAGGKTTPPVLESGQTTITENSGSTKAPVDTLLTAEQEKQLISSEDKILHFVSSDTQLPILAPVKVRFVSRDSVNKDLRKKFDEDKGAKRMERSELVLKKFGLLDQSFQLKPFLLSLLTEQIAGFYDNKTKMMNLLNWVPIDEQAPVMAHELTHALQDQKVGLTKWDDNEIEGTAKNAGEDQKHIAVDETDTAREAVLEGQAMVSFADYALETNGHSGKTLKDFPQMADLLAQGAGDSSDSPVLARAPLVLQQSLLFPYTDGLRFEQVVLTKDGVGKAFAGVLENPPNSSYEIMTPEAYRRHVAVPLMRLPDIHPMLKEAGYEPYDVGVMGELDVRMTAELFGGRPLAEALAPEWDGGVYYAAQRRSATSAEKNTTKSLAILYSSRWKNPDSAHSFFDVFEEELPRQYDGLKRREKDEVDENERVYSTNEGDVLLTLKDNTVWVSEGFELPLARKLRDATDAANVPLGSGPVLTAKGRVPDHDLAGGLVKTMQSFGMMKASLGMADGR
ncbi:hypothetical protein [Granulicella sp. 5B5]|uniref:hypothetical protein n=1 Tax=Granulicella sp. 5B5 TaxID=1617967 RepID=UPI0015F5DA49|nr:hypothetical protein [Granulicella sp. 5B5]